MSESIYDKAKRRLLTINNILSEYTTIEIKTIDIHKKYQTVFDPLEYIIEFDQLKKEYGNDSVRYLNRFLALYESSESLLIDSDRSKLNEHTKPITEISDFVFNPLSNCLKQIIEHLNRLLNPEPEIQETPQKFEKLGAIEKILIVHYLKIESLKRYQYHLKPGIFFLSRLLDLNPDSIKKPVLKVLEYTTENIDSDSKARNLITTLKTVKSFFDSSELKEISKVIETRINELEIKSGKV
ncbi:MAG: hypothetical protein JZU47_07860 [Prolixibacteraceae bacterium]|nr:hypothetical protein [Prolixibacteraceae bacterium]